MRRRRVNVVGMGAVATFYFIAVDIFVVAIYLCIGEICITALMDIRSISRFIRVLTRITIMTHIITSTSDLLILLLQFLLILKLDQRMTFPNHIHIPPLLS